jgi:hypothetical protein
MDEGNSPTHFNDERSSSAFDRGLCTAVVTYEHYRFDLAISMARLLARLVDLTTGVISRSRGESPPAWLGE